MITPPMKNFFSSGELACKCCGANNTNTDFIDKLNMLRACLGFPMQVTSGYRCHEYNEKNGYTQTHATGHAVDIACSHKQAYAIIKQAPRYGITGIGVKQKGGGRFIHLDDLEEAEGRPRPHIWSY